MHAIKHFPLEVYHLVKAYPGSSWIVLTCLVFVVISLAAKANVPSWVKSRWLWLTIGSFPIVVFVASACLYAWSHVLLDHIEATVIATSAIWNDGGPVYHDLDSPQRYSMKYGPGQSIIQGGFLRLFGNTIRVAKIPGLLCALLILVLIFRVIRSQTSTWYALLGCIYCALGLSLFECDAYWTRSDPLLVFSVCLGLAGCLFRRAPIAAFVTAVAIGLAVTGKIHMLLCFFPLLAILYLRKGIFWAMLALALGMIFAFLPFFVFSNISLSNYVVWLRAVGQHPLGIEEFKYNIYCVTLLLIPCAIPFGGAALADLQSLKTLLRSNLLPIAALAVSLLIMMYPATIEGSGPHHFMPYIPILAYGIAKLAHRRLGMMPMDWRRHLTQAAAVAIFLVFAPIAVSHELVAGYHVWTFESPVRNLLREARDFEAQHVGKTVTIGYGSDVEHGYISTNYRAVTALDHQPYLVDSAEVMEVPIPESTLAVLRSGSIAFWLIPAGQEPFSLPTMYKPPKPLFDSAFRQTFFEYYELRSHGNYFDAWQYRERK